MAISIGDVIRVSARFKNAASGDIVNVYHWKASSGTDISDDAAMDAIDAKLSEAWAAIANAVPAAQDPYDIRYDVVEWSGGAEHVVRTLGTRSWVLTTPPSNSGEALPSQDCGIVNFRTAIPRTFGRKYIGALMEGNQAAGTLTGTTLTQLAAFAAAILDAIFEDPMTLVPGTMTNDPSASGNWATFVAAVVNAVVGTQRRRRINRGS